VRAIARKELRQLGRDRRTVALLIFQPVLLLVIFGYAASFDVDEVRTVVVGSQASEVAERLPELFDVEEVAPSEGREDALDRLRSGGPTVAVVATSDRVTALIDGSQLFAAREATAVLGRPGSGIEVDVLFNPDLETAPVLVPALAGIVLVFVGTFATSLGVVRERQAGTMEQLAVMPLRPADVLLGKLVPYVVISLVDLVLVMTVAVELFDVPFEGSVWLFALGAVLFLVLNLAVGLLVSSVSENQGQAIQLAMLTALPQILLSGAIFPLESMAAGVRWLGYLMPLTWFVKVSRAVMLRDAAAADLVVPLVILAVLALVVFGLAVTRIRRDLAPAPAGRGAPAAAPAAAPMTLQRRDQALALLLAAVARQIVREDGNFAAPGSAKHRADLRPEIGDRSRPPQST
jgi:ABC-2 type transport system permease protein